MEGQWSWGSSPSVFARKSGFLLSNRSVQALRLSAYC
uniref:Binding n=1 Tax=Arundo donax TaxID=35708 RepID=A0A0A9G297_ARUDO